MTTHAETILAARIHDLTDEVRRLRAANVRLAQKLDGQAREVRFYAYDDPRWRELPEWGGNHD